MKALECAGLIARRKRGTSKNGGGRTTDLITLSMGVEKPVVSGTSVPVTAAIVTGTKYTGNSGGELPEHPFQGTYIKHSRGPKKVLARKSVSGRYVESNVVPFPKLGDAA